MTRRKRLREDWYELECRPYVQGRVVDEPEYREIDNNHGFACGDGTPREKAEAWARDLTWDWCARTGHEPGRWDVTLWRLDDFSRKRLRTLAKLVVRWPMPKRRSDAMTVNTASSYGSETARRAAAAVLPPDRSAGRLPGIHANKAANR